MTFRFYFRHIKRALGWAWLLTLATALWFLWTQPELFKPESLAAHMQVYGDQTRWAFLSFALVRGFFLLPALPMMLAGLALFPDENIFVWLVSMGSVGLSATLLYYLSERMGISDYLQQKYPRKMDSLKRKLEHPSAFLLVVLWSFFPFVPTDLMCYLARVVQMPYRSLMLGVFIGEALLLATLSWGWDF